MYLGFLCLIMDALCGEFRAGERKGEREEAVLTLMHVLELTIEILAL